MLKIFLLFNFLPRRGSIQSSTIRSAHYEHSVQFKFLFHLLFVRLPGHLKCKQRRRIRAIIENFSREKPVNEFNYATIYLRNACWQRWRHHLLYIRKMTCPDLLSAEGQNMRNISMLFFNRKKRVEATATGDWLGSFVWTKNAIRREQVEQRFVASRSKLIHKYGFYCSIAIRISGENVFNIFIDAMAMFDLQ